MYPYPSPYGPRRRPRRLTPWNEALDLIISWAALTLAFGAGALIRGDIRLLGAAALAVGTAFVGHELAHRAVARHYGMAAAYKANYPFLAFTLALALITAKYAGTPFVIAAPGAVVVMPLFGPPHPYVSMLIAAAGPLTNEAIGAAAVVASYALPPAIAPYLALVGRVNLWLGFFNLLPIPPMDGWQVMRYSLTAWASMIVLALALLIAL